MLGWDLFLWCTLGWGFVQCVLCGVLNVCMCLFCGFAVITGSHKAAVASALTRVEVLIESFRRKQPFTHFLSFALNHPQIQEGFNRFREEVLDHCSQVSSRIRFVYLSWNLSYRWMCVDNDTYLSSGLGGCWGIHFYITIIKEIYYINTYVVKKNDNLKPHFTIIGTLACSAKSPVMLDEMENTECCSII